MSTTFIWTDPTTLRGRPWVPLLAPFWGHYHPDHHNHPYSITAKRYEQIGKEIFQITSPDKAKWAVLPFAWDLVVSDVAARHDAEAFIKTSACEGLRTLVFFNGDSDEKIADNNVILCKPNCYRSQFTTNEVAMPFWGGDLTQTGMPDGWFSAPWQPKASIGFRGAVYTSLKKGVSHQIKNLLRLILRRHRGNDAVAIRTKAIRALANSPFVSTDFSFIENSWLAQTYEKERSFLALRESHRLFAQNVIQNPYTLCVRGGGNFSVRFYEVLSAGRIPVFVDTDCVLPAEDHVPWKDLCVWVDSRRVDQIGTILANFHARLDTDRLADLQRTILKAWQTHICPDAFYSTLPTRVERVCRQLDEA